MTLRGNGSGGIISSGGKLVSGDSECCCCKCCWCYSGDEKMINGLSGTHFLEVGDWIITIIDSTLLRGEAAGNYCGVKFLLELTAVDQLEEHPICYTTGTAELICDCTLCEDVFWEFTLEPCPDVILPSVWWMGDGCLHSNCDDPTCSNCADVGLTTAAANISDPDGSVRCRCPGDNCVQGEEI